MGISDNLVNFLLEDGYGNLWAATKNGVSKLEAENWRTYTTADGLGHNYIHYLLNDSNGNLWAATEVGISRFVSDMDSWLPPLSRISCKRIIEDRQGVFWIATDRGVFRYEPSTISPQTRIVEGPAGVVGRASVSFGYVGEDLDTNSSELLYSWHLDNLPWSSFTRSSFVGISAEDGVHTFYVRASDNEGNIDYTPAKRTFRIDTTMPIAVIESPAINQIIRGEYKIIGTAMDETDFNEYELAINLESERDKIFQKIVKYEVGKLGAGGLLATWDSTKIKDGVYIITLTVRDKVEGRDDILHTRTTNATIAVDNTLPIAEIIYVKDKTPDNNKLSGEIQIEGQISDKHLAGYRIEYTKDRTINSLTKWSVIKQSVEPISESSYRVQENWSSASVGGEIILSLVAMDRAGNEFSNTTNLTLSNENPKLIARIEEPVDRAVVGGKDNIIIVFPTPGMDLAEYKLILIETQQVLHNQTKISVTEDLKFNWDTTNLTDGKYTLELNAVDSDGFISTHEITIIVDNTSPTAKIISPLDKSQVGGFVSFAGTATDTNFLDYVIEYENASQPGIWMMIDTRRTIIVNEGKLLEWNPGDNPGNFTIRLTVRDVVEHTSQDFVNIEVLPPIKSQEGGMCFSNDGLATLYLPPRVLPKDIAITVNRVPSNEINSIPNNARFLDLAYGIGPANVKLNPIKPVTLKVNLSSVLSQYQGRIAFFRFDEEWTFIGGTIQGDKAVIGINQLGLYAIMEITGNFEPSEVNSLFTCQPRVISPERRETTISFSLKEANLVTLKVYSLNGRLERTIVSEETMYPGQNALIWDGKNEDGEIVPSGLYFIALKIDKQNVKTKTIIVSNR